MKTTKDISLYAYQAGWTIGVAKVPLYFFGDPDTSTGVKTLAGRQKRMPVNPCLVKSMQTN